MEKFEKIKIDAKKFKILLLQNDTNMDILSKKMMIKKDTLFKKRAGRKGWSNNNILTIEKELNVKFEELKVDE